VNVAGPLLDASVQQFIDEDRSHFWLVSSRRLSTSVRSIEGLYAPLDAMIGLCVDDTSE